MQQQHEVSATLDEGFPLTDHEIMDITEEGEEDDLSEDEKDELAELLAASLPPPSSDLDDLDALLDESVALRDEAASMKSARDRLKRGNLPREDRLETEALIRSWEARRVWETLSEVAVWEKTECACGAVHLNFSHLMHQQRHRHQPGTTRLIKADEWDEALPTIVAHQELTVPICVACAMPEYELDPSTPAIIL